MPTIAPITKVQNCKDLGATVIISGAHIGEARERALAIGREQVGPFIVRESAWRRVFGWALLLL